MYLSNSSIYGDDHDNSDCVLKVVNKDCNANHRTHSLKHVDSPEVCHEEVLSLRTRFPNKIPIVLKRFNNETNLPQLQKYKYLVPQEITMSQFQSVIRSRMKMGPNQALYFLVNNRSMLSLTLTMAEVYQDFAGPDGFLYITYASQEVFGCTTTST